MNSMKMAAAACVAISMAACGPDTGEKQQVGTILGAIGGGLLGAQVGEGQGQLVGVGVGALLGAMIGGEIGRSMDVVDRQLAEQTAIRSLNEVPMNQTSSWQNPDNGHSGSFTPLNTTQPHQGIYCREFQQTVNIGGESQEAYGTACRQPDGQWQIQQG